MLERFTKGEHRHLSLCTVHERVSQHHHALDGIGVQQDEFGQRTADQPRRRIIWGDWLLHGSLAHLHGEQLRIVLL